ncbi:MAG: hypothetical protein EU530_07570, partial [Promethearchaeota archaeon]
MNNSGEKITKVTNTLWRFWWFTLFFLILPFGIAGVTAFGVNSIFSSQITWIEELSYGLFLLIVPVLIFLFMIPYEKYRKNKFFTQKDLPTYKHIVLFTLIPSFPFIYTKVISFILNGLGKEYNTFFGDINLFSRILTPVISIIAISYYLSTRKTTTAIFKPTIKTIDRPIVAISLVIQSISVIFLPTQALLPFLLLNSILFLLMMLVYHFLGSKEPTNAKLPIDFKIRLFFNIITMIHLVSSLLMIGWTYWLHFSLDIWLIIFQTPIILILTLKGMFIYSYNQITHLNIAEYSSSQYSLQKASVILAMIAVFLDLGFFIYSWNQLLFQILSVCYVLIIFMWIVLDHLSKIITKTGAKIASIISSFLFMSLLSILIPIDPKYQITIGSVLLYIDLALLGYWKILDRSKVAVIHAFLFSVILLEVLYALGDLAIERLTPLLSNPSLVIWLRFFLFGLAFSLSSILSLFRVVLKRFKGKVSHFIKWMFFVLHFILGITIVGIVYLTLGTVITGSLTLYWLFFKVLIPLLVYIPINGFMFWRYFRYGIYSKIGLVNIIGYNVNVFSILLGLTSVVFLRSIGGYLIFSFFVTIGLIIHLYMKKQNQILDEKIYRKWLVVLHPLMLFEINVGILLVFIQNLNLNPSLSIFTSMLITQLLLLILRKLKWKFTIKFSTYYNITSMLLQAIFLPIWLDPILDMYIINYSAELTPLLSSLIPFVTSLIYIVAIFTYSIKSGVIINKFVLKLTNLAYLGLYISISLIPSYFILIFIPSSVVSTLFSHIFYASAVLLIGIVLDTLLFHGIFIGPRLWVLQSLNTKRITKEIGTLTKTQLHAFEKATGLQLDIGEENQIKLNEQIVAEFLNTPKKFYGIPNALDKVISNLFWIFSVFVTLCSIIFVIQANLNLQLSMTLALLLPGILSYATIILLTQMMIISDHLKVSLYNILFIYNVFSCAIVLFPLVQKPLISLMGSSNASIIAFDVSAGFAFGSFQILKRRLVERSPAFYYITLFSLWVVFSSVLIFSAAFAASVISSIAQLTGTVFALIFTNTVFIVFLTLGFILIAILGATSYIFKYNSIIITKTPVYTVFSAEELEERKVSGEEIEFLKKRGFAQKNTEIQLRERMKLLRTYGFRHVISLITYFITPIFVFILGLLLGKNGISFFTSKLVLESVIGYFSFVLLLFSIDYRFMKFLNRELNNQFRCFIWIIYQILVAFSAAFILELTWYGRVLLFMQIFSMMMPPLNYFLKNSGFKVNIWTQRSEIITKLLIVTTSTAYLANLSLSALSYNLQTPSMVLFGITPYLLLLVHLTFHITYFQKETSLRRYYRTYNRSYPYIMISLYLIRYRAEIFAYVPSWMPLLDYILPIIAVMMILWSLFYYYSMVRQFNVIMNFFYQLLLLFIGFLFTNYMIARPFIILWGYGFLVTESILISCGFTFILFYYMRKAAYFEIYRGFTEEEPVRFRAIGIIAGSIRTIGITLMIGAVFMILDAVFNISITRWAMGSLNLQILALVNSIFIWAFSSFIGLILLLFFLKGYFKNFIQHSYNSRFVVRIWTVLAAAITVGMAVIIYEPIFFYALPPILVGCYIWLLFIQKKNPYRANLTIGTAKSLLIFLFVFWIIHQYIFGLLFRSIEIDASILLSIELFLSAGITGFVFSRSFQNLLIRAKKLITWVILVSAVAEICISAFLVLNNIGTIAGNPLLILDPVLSLTISVNFGILLLYMSVAIQQWKISKKIWDAAWWLWLFLPIINFALIYRSIQGIDSITQTFNIFGVEIPGSILLTIIISTLLYLPVILTKFKKAYKFFFFITWIEAIPVWIWLAPNLFSSLPSAYLSPLFVIVLSLISLVPFLFSLKYWRIIAGVWVIIAITNAIFLSLLVTIEFVPDSIMDIFIHICTYGLYIIIFLSNPVIKTSWKRYDYGILLGFILLVVGASFLIFGFAYVLLGKILYALTISGFVTGSIMISGRYVKLIQKKIYPYAIMLIAASIGLGSFIFLFDFQILPVTMDFSWIGLNSALTHTLFPFSVGLVSSSGVVLLAQAQGFINKKHWRLTFAIFAVAIGFTAGSVLDSLFQLTNPLFAAVVSFWAVLMSYPTFRYKKAIFWGLFPLFIAYSAVFSFEYAMNLLHLGWNHTLGINFTFWISSFSLASILIHKIVSVYFAQKYTKITSQLIDMGISDFKTLPYIEDDTDEFMAQQKEIGQKLIRSFEILPMFYVSPRRMAHLNSIFSTLLLFSLSYFIAFITPVIIIYQILIFVFGLSMSTFIILEYNKKKGIFGNPIFIRIVRFISSNLLYASILYGIIILNQFFIPIIFNIIPSLSITTQLVIYLNIASDGLVFYLTFLILSNWIHFYNRLLTLFVKILSWVTFLIGLGLFIGYLVSYMFAVVITITIGSYTIVLHLKQHHKKITINLRLMAKSASVKLSDPVFSEIAGIDDIEILSGDETLGIDIPVPIQPPIVIHHEDITNEADFEEVKDVLDQLLPGSIPSNEDSGESEEIEIEETSPEPLETTLQLIAKQEKRTKILSIIIRELDAWIKQGFIVEISYLFAIILSNLLPSAVSMSVYHLYIFRFTFFACFATGFYNIPKLIPTRYRLVVVQILLAMLIITTIMLPFSIISVYGMQLYLVGDGIFLPVGQLHTANIIFLVTIILFAVIFELEIILWNYVQTKNQHLRKPILDKWNDFLHPFLLVLAAFIIANIFSLTQPLISRLMFASIVLFGEAIIEKYVLKIFNRLTRARILLYSWILISVIGIIQFLLILPILPFPITLIVLALVVLLGAQFITLFLVYQLKNEKIIRNYNINPKVLSHYKYQMFTPATRIGIKNRALDTNYYDHSEKLITYKDFISPKYSVMAILGYFLVSFLISAIIYEVALLRYITPLVQQLNTMGILTNFIDLWNNPIGIRFILLSGVPFFIAILASFIFFLQDQFTVKILRVISRDIFLILLWTLLTVSLIFYGLAFIQFLEGVTFSNLIIPLIIAVISAAQYYTIFLITDITIHTAKNMDKLESLYPHESLETKSHNELMEMLTKIEPKSLKIVKTVNLIFATIIYCTISVVVYILMHIITGSIIISLSLALLILYGQAELNNYVLKAFPPKINYLYSVLSWIVFSLFISLIPAISLWNTNPS